MSSDYPDTVLNAIKKHTGLCVGLDPSTELLLSWGLNDDLSGLKAFSDRMVEVCIQTPVGFVKPQSAFYERFGWSGCQVLTALNTQLRQAGVLTLLDAKRGDISSTSYAYAEAYLSAEELSKFNAMTVNPFLGYDSLTPFIDKLAAEAVGIFVVLRSSNVEAGMIQQAKTKQGLPASVWLARQIRKDNARLFGVNRLGAIGAVIGATLTGMDALMDHLSTALLLCPGIGAQGATVGGAVQKFKRYIHQCIFPMSRSISLYNPRKEGLVKKIQEIKQELRKSVELLTE